MDANEPKMALRAILFEQVEIEIAMALEGEIPPVWKTDRLQDLKQALEDGIITEREYVDLCERFLAAVNSTSQITDQEYAARCVKESCGELLFYWEGPGDSLVRISKEENGYHVFVYLDEAEQGNKLEASVERCLSELCIYANKQGLELANRSRDHLPQGTFTVVSSLQEAVERVFAMIEI